MNFGTYVGVVCTVSVLLVAAVRLKTHAAGYGPMAVLIVLTSLCAVSNKYPMTFVRGTTEVAFTLDYALVVFGLLHLPPQSVVIMLVAGTFFGCAARKVRGVKLAFNLAEAANLASTAVLLATTIVRHPSRTQAFGSIGSVTLGILVGAGVSMVSFAIAIRTLTPEEPHEPLHTGLGAWLVTWTGGVSLGLLAAITGHDTLWKSVVALVPVALINVVLHEHLLARRDRERADGLFSASVAAHASIDGEAVATAISQSAQTMLQCESATVTTRPPLPDQIGQRLTISGSNERWLVASKSLNPKGFNNDDTRLLDVLAAIGSTALENANLVYEIRHQAHHDSLTGLPNQRMFADKIAAANQRRDESGEPFTVAVFDLDDFKKVNDTLGHTAGNELLVAVAERLRGAVRLGDTVARLGADDFTLIFPGVGSHEEALALCGRIHESIAAPLVISNQRIFITATIGLTRSPVDGTTADELLKCADVAMHGGKESGGNTTVLYASDMNAQAEADLRRQTELHHAVANDELRVFYQPQVNLSTNKIVGVEALVRWQHPELGMLAPFAFIPLAERSDLIVDVDRWVLNETVRQAKVWDSMGLTPIRVAVNLSGRHLKQLDVVENVVNVLKRWDLSPNRLELEVTEGVTDRETDDSLRKLNEFRALGIELAIDDFGTGYSGLARLGQFPIDRLKIDRSFIMVITPEEPEAPIVSAMIAMAHSLKLEVIAEGVETELQLEYVRSLGCEEVQGFYFSKPVPAQEIVEKLLAQDAPAAAENTTQTRR